MSISWTQVKYELLIEKTELRKCPRIYRKKKKKMRSRKRIDPTLSWPRHPPSGCPTTASGRPAVLRPSLALGFLQELILNCGSFLGKGVTSRVNISSLHRGGPLSALTHGNWRLLLMVGTSWISSTYFLHTLAFSEKRIPVIWPR